MIRKVYVYDSVTKKYLYEADIFDYEIIENSTNIKPDTNKINNKLVAIYDIDKKAWNYYSNNRIKVYKIDNPNNFREIYEYEKIDENVETKSEPIKVNDFIITEQYYDKNKNIWVVDIDKIRENKKKILKTRHENYLATYNGFVKIKHNKKEILFDSNEKSLKNITYAIGYLSRNNSKDKIKWRDYNNNIVDVDIDLLNELYVLVSDHISMVTKMSYYKKWKYEEVIDSESDITVLYNMNEFDFTIL